MSKKLHIFDVLDLIAEGKKLEVVSYFIEDADFPHLDTPELAKEAADKIETKYAYDINERQKELKRRRITTGYMGKYNFSMGYVDHYYPLYGKVIKRTEKQPWQLQRH